MGGLGEYGEEKNNTIKIPLGCVKVLALKLERIIVSKEAAGINRLWFCGKEDYSAK